MPIYLPLAIPSPDLILNLFASVGQLLGLGAVLLGGAAWSRRGTGDARSESSPWTVRILAGLLGATAVCFLLYHLQVVDRTEQRMRVNLSRSSTEAGQSVGDTSLKTLSFSGQLEHPRGMDTADLEERLNSGLPLNLIDVRETEEVERGSIPGSWHTRYPDLAATGTGMEVAGSATVLLCFSGNRSSELADQFNGDGVPCYFLVGGYEKWIAEGRELDLGEDVTRDSLRALPDFENKDTLLATDEVLELVQQDAAIFIDVRYPEDFAQGHLPGAINVPLRKLSSEQVATAMEGLAPGPVIVPCYDKRSSFYGSILGLKLSRAGRPFLGRYTLPHEYTTPKQQRAHVGAWEQAQAGQSPLGKLTALMETIVVKFSDSLGSLALSVILLVLLSRLLLLPLSWKADRDQALGAHLSSRFENLKRKHRADPALAVRERLAMQKAAGLTPFRNLFGTSLQLILLLALFAAIARVANDSQETFGWLTMGARDSTYLLPTVVSLLMGVLVIAGHGLKAGKGRLTLAALAAAGLGALIYDLPAAQNLYLVGSLGWITVQTELARRAVREHLVASAAQENAPSLPVSQPSGAVVPLRECAYTAGVGKKAQRLGELMQAGLQVPDGFVLPEATLRRAEAGRLLAPDLQATRQAFHGLGAQEVAVRSSGSNEDGADKSYAGVFESVLGVTNETLEASVQEVVHSMSSELSKIYGEEEEECGGVVVQTMVDAEYAGVLFTEHPSNAGSMMIELVAGLGDDLVSGRATPKGFAYGRLTHDLLQDEEPPIDLQGLINLAVKAETLFGCAQDIEWAYAGGEFYLLQARNVTASTSRREDQVGIREAERGRLVALAKKSLEVEGSELLGMNELSELLPRPTPMSLAMMNALWAPGGSVDLACRSFGIGYNALQESPSLVEGAFGTLWINCKEMGRRESDVSLLVAFRMARGAEMISSRFREEILPAIERNTRWIEWSQLEKRSGPELVSLFEELRTRFLTETYVEAERINIAADVYMGGARRRLEREDLDPAEYLSHMPVTVVSEAFELLPAIRRGEATVSDFLVHYGHRAPHDFELSEPRYRENHAAVTELSDLTAGSILHESEHDSQASVPSGRLTALEVQRARDFQALKEEAKHGALREYAALRRILLALGHVSELGEDIFWLEPDELQLIEFDSKAVVPRELLECIELRQRRFQAFADLDLPSTITIQNLERMNLTGTGPALDRERDGGELQGLHVAGAHDVVGLVRKLDCAADLSTFKTGEILVTRFTDPSWTAVFPRAGGLVTEVGGWLSHAAIQAREYGLSCIVGAEGARDAFETGDLVRLATDGSVELLSNRRRHERQQLEGKRGYTVEVAVRGQVLKANLIDLSKAGAGLQVSEGALELEESVEFRGLNRAPLSARVVRRGENGDIGIQFDRELDEIPDALETVA